MAKRLSKTTQKQYEILLNFLKNNIIVLRKNNNARNQIKISQLWDAFAEEINSLGVGPKKTTEQWRNVSMFLSENVSGVG